jgi:hypothetical protein
MGMQNLNLDQVQKLQEQEASATCVYQQAPPAAIQSPQEPIPCNHSHKDLLEM